MPALESSVLSEAEQSRLAALAGYAILDTLPEEEYDAITHMASQICGAPISLISLLDDHRQWFKSAHGVSIREAPRQDAFCQYAIQTPDELTEIDDARLDERFVNNALVINEPQAVFYAGVPLVDPDGQALGTLCVMDRRPRCLSVSQKTALKALARQVVSQLKLRRSQALLEKANQQLQASNAVLQAIADNCPAGLILWEAIREDGQIVDFRYVFTNPINAQMTGLSVDQMTGQTLKGVFPDLFRKGMFNRLVTVVETRQAQQYQQHEELNERMMWGSFSLVAFGDGVLCTVQDITYLKKTEELLRTHTEKLTRLVAERTDEIGQLSALQNAILQNTGLSIVSTDPEGRILMVNPATEAMLGYQADELIGKVTPLMLHDRTALRNHAAKLGKQLGRVVTPDFELLKLLPPGAECVLMHKDSRRIPVVMTINALCDPSGAVTGYVGMATDITALKAARDELQKRNREISTFFEVALDLHCIADKNGNVLKINRAWLVALGYTAVEAAALNYFDLVHPDDYWPTKQAIQEAVPQQPQRNMINRIRRKDGVYRLIEWNLILIDTLLYASARDITQRQQVERQLRSSNQRLQLATQAVGQGIWEYDLKRDILIWDERMCEMHAMTPRKTRMHYQDFLQMIHPDDLPHYHRTGVPDEKGMISCVVRIIRADGVIRFMETHGLVVKDKAGVPVQIVGVVWDVTERKQAEYALSQSEERYRLLVNNLIEVIFQADLDGRWTFLNPSWTRLSGYAVEESLGQPFYTYVPPEDQASCHKLFGELFSGRKMFSRHVIRYVHKTGEYRWAEIFTRLVLDEHEQPVGATGTIIDITERKQALIALRDSEQRFREFAENIDEVFWIHSAQPFEMLYVNPAYERLWGQSCQSLYDDVSSVLNLMVKEDRPMAIEAFKRYRNGEEISVQYRVRHPDGAIRWMSTRTFVMRNPAGKPLRYIGIANDITSQKEKEGVLEQSLVREQELNRLKSQFVSTASHEFRTPLATIQSSVDLIKVYLNRPQASAQSSIRRHLDVIEKEIINFGELLTAILTIGRAEAGRIPFEPRWIDLPGVCTDVIHTHFTDRPDGRMVRWSMAGPVQPIYADSKLIAHVLINLLSNAFKFSKSDAELKILFEDRQVVLLIRDHGIGIPPGELTHLFETFFRASNALNIQGSGLGLVIARQFIELHGGGICIESEENKGTTCRIKLPVNVS